MNASRFPLCKINRHSPVRRDVQWDGLHYVGTCECCGEAIRRQGKGNWKRDWNPNVRFRGVAA